MKKSILLTAISILICSEACAETILVIDDNNVIKQQIYTGPAVQQPVQQTVYVSGQPLPPQQVIVTQQQTPAQVIVVRETPTPRNYYYDPVRTSVLAGFGGAVIGSALFHHHGHRPRPHFHHRR